MRSPGLGADDVRAREADEPGGDLALWIRCVRAERLMAESERRCALTERALSEGLATVQAVLDLAPIEMVMTDAAPGAPRTETLHRLDDLAADERET